MAFDSNWFSKDFGGELSGVPIESAKGDGNSAKVVAELADGGWLFESVTLCCLWWAGWVGWRDVPGARLEEDEHLEPGGAGGSFWWVIVSEVSPGSIDGTEESSIFYFG